MAAHAVGKNQLAQRPEKKMRNKSTGVVLTKCHTPGFNGDNSHRPDRFLTIVCTSPVGGITVVTK